MKRVRKIIFINIEIYNLVINFHCLHTILFHGFLIINFK